MHQEPPKWASRFFERVCNGTQLEGIEGDLYELFEQRKEERGLFKARLFYLLDIATLMRSSIIKPKLKNSNSNNMDNFYNYIKIAYRAGFKSKFFSFIHLLGLTLGISSILFIVIYLLNEYSYDKHIANYENKYRLYDVIERPTGDVDYLPLVPPTFGPNLSDNFSQIENIGRLFVDYGGTVFKIEDQIFSEKNGFFAELTALELLDIKIISGSLVGLEEPNSLLLSQSLFQKFFGNVEFNNQELDVEGTSFVVAGLYKDFPKQTHITPDYFISFQYLLDNNSQDRLQSWLWHQFYTYVELNDQVDINVFRSQMESFITEKAKPQLEEIGITYTTHLQPLKDIHLYSEHFEMDNAERNSNQNMVFLAIAALVILLIACLNFINLTSAQAIKRAKEVGIRKFVGARKQDIFIQHCIEAFLYVLISGVFSILILFIFLPAFNQFTAKTLEIGEIFTVRNLLLYLAFLIIISLIAGIYPAWLLTKIKEIEVVKGLKHQQIKVGALRWSIDFRQVLVGLQYALSIGLIIISIVVFQQYQYMREADLGFNKENLLVIRTTGAMRRDMEGAKKAFGGHSNVRSVTFSYGVPGGIVAGDGVIIPSQSTTQQTSKVFVVDYNFLETLELDLIAGRDFSIENRTDHAEAFIVSEEAIKTLGLGTPEKAIGIEIQWNHWQHQDSLKRGNVIGVVKDFNVQSMHQAVSPVVIHLRDAFMRHMIIRIGDGNLKETIDYLGDQYQNFAQDRPFEFTFLDQTFQEFYMKEERMSQLFSLFTVFAIITSLIGLLGLVSYTINNKSKELSIRKVLGASNVSIYQLLVNRYILLILISFVIAGPIAFMMLGEWLDSFAYKTSIDVWVFLKVLVLILMLTLLLVSTHVIKGINKNPADRLRMD